MILGSAEKECRNRGFVFIPPWLDARLNRRRAAVVSLTADRAIFFISHRNRTVLCLTEGRGATKQNRKRVYISRGLEVRDRWPANIRGASACWCSLFSVVVVVVDPCENVRGFCDTTAWFIGWLVPYRSFLRAADDYRASRFLSVGNFPFFPFRCRGRNNNNKGCRRPSPIVVYLL